MGDEKSKAKPVKLTLVTDNAAGAAAPLVEGGGDGSEPDLRPVQFSDDAIARALSEQLGAEWRHAGGDWYRWNGRRWMVEKTQLVLDISRKVCRGMSHEADNQKIARQISSKSVIYAASKLAENDRAHATELNAFDADDWLINTPDGPVALHKGNLCVADPDLLMSKIAGAGPGDADAKNAPECPNFLAFLRQATGRDQDLMNFLQRAVGYCLTGSIEEHAIFFLHGPGGTGKSLFLSTLTDLLGDYAQPAPMDLFTVSTGERHPADLALLHGARLVTASETEEGRRWDEAKLKAITGGDPITARRIRQDYFTFRPKFKLFMAGNFRPAMRSADDAMRRRFHIIPFVHKPEKADKDLPDKIRGELAGVMRWAIAGALEWQRIGLNPPVGVRSATDDYFAAENVMAKFVAERCETGGEELTALTKDLFRDFKSWAATTGEYVGSERRFVQRLEKEGVKRWRHPATRAMGFCGIKLLHVPDDMFGGGVGARKSSAPDPTADYRTDPADEFDR